MISVRGVSKSFGSQVVLQDLNLEVEAGKTTTIVGPSGAGKSSIADLLVGLYEPSEGQIWVDENLLTDLDLPSWQQRLGVVWW